MNPQQMKIMKQMQEMQQKMEQAQAELATEMVEASAGGGMVTVVVGGDLVVAATNEAIRSAQDLAQKKLGGVTGGLDLGGLSGLF
jgi:hypothetical protein